jgi:predicted nucleotidyltransferase
VVSGCDFIGLASSAIMLGEVAMISLSASEQARLADLCRRYGVRRLELFGSAATPAFEPNRSDVDFLVEFLPEQDLGPWLSHYFAFRTELARLFGRPVDLVMAGAARNPHFRRELERTRTLLYAA